MKTMITGLGLTLLWLAGLYNGVFSEPGEEIPAALIYACFAAWGISALGAMLMLAGIKKAGFILVAIGSILFIPLGLVTLFGAKRLKQGEELDALQQRRELTQQPPGTTGSEVQ